jgi:hypothetical protein
VAAARRAKWAAVERARAAALALLARAEAVQAELEDYHACHSHGKHQRALGTPQPAACDIDIDMLFHIDIDMQAHITGARRG